MLDMPTTTELHATLVRQTRLLLNQLEAADQGAAPGLMKLRPIADSVREIRATLLQLPMPSRERARGR